MCPTRRYTHDDNFFALNNEKAFYWAGFIAADGCILTKKIKGVEYLNGLSLNLSDKDRSHVELFRDHILFTGPISDGIVKNKRNNPNWKDTGCSSIVIYSHVIYEDLCRFNIVPRKTHTYTFPQWLIDHPLVHHYMRGYFDGDGCIRVDTKGNKRFELRGTIPFLTDYKHVLMKNCGANDNQIKKSNGIGRVRYNGNGICSVLYPFLYNGATVFLERKKYIFSEDSIVYQKVRDKYVERQQ